MENSEENMHVDTGAQRVKDFTVYLSLKIPWLGFGDS